LYSASLHTELKVCFPVWIEASTGLSYDSGLRAFMQHLVFPAQRTLPQWKWTAQARGTRMDLLPGLCRGHYRSYLPVGPSRIVSKPRTEGYRGWRRL